MNDIEAYTSRHLLNGQTDSPFRAPMGDRRCFYWSEVAAVLGVNRAQADHLRASGKFPLPDLCRGKVPLWSRETLDLWIKKGCHA